MKLNVHDPKAQDYAVFLDGEEERFCFEADEELGEAKCFVTRGPKGSEEILCTENDLGEPVPSTITKHGKVEFRKKR